MNNPSSNSPLFGRFLSGLFIWKIWLFLQIFQGSKNFYRFLYHYLYRRPKIDRILGSDVIYIPEKKLYSIPLEPYSEFINKVERGDISKVRIGNQVILYQLKNPLESLAIPGNPPVNPPESSNPYHPSHVPNTGIIFKF